MCGGHYVWRDLCVGLLRTVKGRGLQVAGRRSQVAGAGVGAGFAGRRSHTTLHLPLRPGIARNPLDGHRSCGILDALRLLAPLAFL